jgi:hypothetical protein
MQVSVTRVVRAGLVSAVVAALTGLVAAGAASAQAATHHPSGAVKAALHTAGSPVRLALAAGLYTDVFTEAPNGAVYFAANGTVAVVNGTSAPKSVLSAKHVLALAANTTDFFVQTGLTVTEYTRARAAKVRAWTLTSPVAAITSAGLYAVGSTVWSWTDWATDSTGFEYATVSEINATSAATPKVISRSNAYPGDMAADSTGAYFEVVKSNQANGYVIRAVPGSRAHRVADVNLDAPLTLSGGRVDLLALHSSNAHIYIDSYQEKTLTGARSKRAPATARAIAGTSAGLLVVQEPCPTDICAKATVGVLNPLTGTVSHPVTVPGAVPLLLGSGPAVIKESGRWLYLVRLAG